MASHLYRSEFTTAEIKHGYKWVQMQYKTNTKLRSRRGTVWCFCVINDFTKSLKFTEGHSKWLLWV